MADISKLKIAGTSYNVKDTVARDNITSLSSLGKFLSLWNFTTGKPMSEGFLQSGATTYNYQTGDYFRVGTFDDAGTKLQPSGSSYTHDVASTTVYTELLNAADIFFYDGSNWVVQKANRIGGVWGSITGTLSSQTDLQTALNAKSVVSVAATGTATDSVKYITINGTEKKIGTDIIWGNVSGTLSNQTDLQTALDGKSNVTASDTGSTSEIANYITIDGLEYKVGGSSGGTSDFNALINRPKYDGVVMDGTTDIPKIEIDGDNKWIENDSNIIKHIGPDTTSVTKTLPNTAQTPAFGGSFTIPVLEYDNCGHIANATTTTVTIPTPTEFNDTKVENVLNNTAKYYVTGTETSVTNTGTQVFDSGIYATTTAGQLHADNFEAATTVKIGEWTITKTATNTITIS